jgi:hypothetical protein
MAVVNAIGSILMAIVNGIVAVFDIIIGCLTCNRAVSCSTRTSPRQDHHTYTSLQGGRRKRHTSAV